MNDECTIMTKTILLELSMLLLELSTSYQVYGADGATAIVNVDWSCNHHVQPS